MKTINYITDLKNIKLNCDQTLSHPDHELSKNERDSIIIIRDLAIIAIESKNPDIAYELLEQILTLYEILEYCTKNKDLTET